ncbi:hypothetical protein SRHO_G00330650 [Serrasalmus rhombeus]
MKRSVFVEFALFALIPLSEAGCWHGVLKKGATHCQDGVDKTWHPVGSSWTNSRCVQCDCNSAALTCCYGMPRVGKFADDCTVEYNYDTCTYKVFKKSDPTIECPHAAVLK